MSTRELLIEAMGLNTTSEAFILQNVPLFTKEKSMLEEFKENLTRTSSHWYEVSNATEIKPLIHILHPEANVIGSATSEVRGSKDLNHMYNPCELEEVDVAVIRAEFGVAETGMLWVSQQNMPIHALDHLSRHLVILLHPDRLVKDMREAYEEVYSGDINFGSFISGPFPGSKTKAKRQRKQHGPKSVTVCFI
ncbi:L-lactate dehydrogenase complex protein LldG [Parabacteroides sp. PFB2-10]|uniref:LUD domain-containing protein n=1 Tax=Parabacteroides sp. PFB2-10 TaxID=1742405 RepID=UPI00247389AF|nr:LUD domain-containing protein [Parabacteroides sp. PFB2-10]MDH6313833.1 L-lactate dehydrogenase complex protein LldG [Parabacteroides sp. PFB2-10]MDL2244911.1 lactate utilization protein [Parabacteroides sp. OttesenSCG-928-J18]